MSNQLPPSLPPFENEPYVDFRDPAVWQRAQDAWSRLQASVGQRFALLLDGKWVGERESFVSLNPSRQSQVVSEHARATVEDAIRAVEAADAYFPTWSAVPAEERIRLTVHLAALMRERKMDLDALLVLESGKSWVEAEADVAEAIDFCEYYAREMQRLAGSHPMHPQPHEDTELRYLPLGVGIVIPPWNFPFAILAGMSIASLVTGNTIVLKPSSDTPRIACAFVELALEAGFPAQCIQLLTGPGGQIGDALVQHPRTRYICFTGSKPVGLRVNELAARTAPGQIWIKRVIAEMGGKDAILVDAEADLDAAAQGVLAAAYGFSGQKCSACSRAIVDQAVYEPFLEKLLAGAATLKVGSAEEPGIHLGPVINARALSKMLEYIEGAKAEARLVFGGKAIPGDALLLEPTIFADVAPTATIFREEIFGPVLAVTPARDFNHALELVNDSEYGLTGAIYSANPEKLDRARREFHVGNLYVNRKCTGAMVAAHPFGGFNMSGTDSKAGGPDYLMLFLQAKSIATRRAG
ncbi:MAG: L-glutamate gamma-semialdehyde dehydrogenase [Bryobacterales bacterium]|jgi:1-pyrroline-5-carboxylate dehydrogenase|nr:L-glutamate gamma-semialdehyde dehydrogenase [Bryobacterales bacterium]